LWPNPTTHPMFKNLDSTRPNPWMDPTHVIGPTCYRYRYYMGCCPLIAPAFAAPSWLLAGADSPSPHRYATAVKSTQRARLSGWRIVEIRCSCALKVKSIFENSCNSILVPFWSWSVLGFLYSIKWNIPLKVYTSCTNRNTNEYSVEKLQNLQVCLNCSVATCLIKLKPHKTAHLEVGRHSILLGLLDSKSESVS